MIKKGLKEILCINNQVCLRKKLNFLIECIIILFLILFPAWGHAQGEINNDPNCGCVDIRISNITSNNAVISWISPCLTTAEVHYDTNSFSLRNIAFDKRGQNIASSTHYHSLDNLDPNTEYFYQILQNNEVCSEGSFSTGPDIGLLGFSPTVYGQAFDPNGIPFEEVAIIYLRIQAVNGVSSLLSTLTFQQGGWRVNLSPRTENLDVYFPFTNEDILLIEGFLGQPCFTGLLNNPISQSVIPNFVQLQMQECPNNPNITVTLHATPTSGCAPLAVIFQVTTSGISDPTQSWDFGDETTSIEQDPVHQYGPGIYTATLTMQTDAGNPIKRTVTIESKPFCPIYTIYTIFFYGNVDIDNEGLDIGNWIGAFVQDVTVNEGCIGSFKITDKGDYGTMAVYGDDPNTTEKDGALENDQLIFKAFLVNEGRMVTLNPTGPDESIWRTANLSQALEINLSTSSIQEIHLCQGWNLISFQVNVCYYQETKPTVFLPQEVIEQNVGYLSEWLSDDNTSPLRDAVDPNKAGDWERITSFDADGAHLLDKNIPPNFNTLKYLSAGYGYWIKMNSPGILVLEGQSIPTNETLQLQTGWNLIGYTPRDLCYADKASEFICPFTSGVYPAEENILHCLVDPLIPLIFGGIDGKYRRIISFDCCDGATMFDTHIPLNYNTLSYIGPKYGYWVKIDDPEGAALVFPTNSGEIP